MSGFRPGPAMADVPGAQVVERPHRAVVTGEGPPLVLVHGLLASGEMFAPIVPALSTRHRLVIPDLRGMGQSANMPGPFTPAQLADDVAGLLTHLGISRATVMGYSQGGQVALQLQNRHPELVGALILACTYAFNGSTWAERMQIALGGWLLGLIGPQRVGALALDMSGGTRMTADQKVWMRTVISGCPREKAVALFKEAMATDSREALPGINVPTLVVVGGQDKADPAKLSDVLRKGIAGAQFAKVDGAGHFLIVTHPEALLEILNGWLAQHGQGIPSR